MHSDMSERPLLSFCIAAYQRTDITLELVNEILSIKDDRFNIIICDDHSQDGGMLEYKKIEDKRVLVYENEDNLGGYVNICRALDHGNGDYIFYVNDRDNVDSFKVERLLDCMEEIKKRGIAFGRCLGEYSYGTDVVEFEAGEKAVLEFACKITHPTGYFFDRELWQKTERLKFFESQSYGDYAFSIVCGLLARNHKGAYLFGDVCDLQRHRIDFSTVTSNFNKKRDDKSLWYSPEAMNRELKALICFMKEYGYDPDITKRCFIKRYREYMTLVTLGLKRELKNDANTLHYKIRRPRSNFEVGMKVIQNRYDLRKMVRILIRDFSLLDYEYEVSMVDKENHKQVRLYLLDEILDSATGLNYKWPKQKKDDRLYKLKRGYRYIG